MYQTGCNAYRQSAGNAVEDKRIVLLKLYDGVLRFIAQAQRGIQEGAPKIRGENISKAMAIIEELSCALDMERGGQLSAQLDGLYRYVINLLTMANVHNDISALGKASGILATLKEGFETAVREQKMAVAAPPQAEGGARIPEGVRFAI